MEVLHMSAHNYCSQRSSVWNLVASSGVVADCNQFPAIPPSSAMAEKNAKAVEPLFCPSWATVEAWWTHFLCRYKRLIVKYESYISFLPIHPVHWTFKTVLCVTFTIKSALMIL